MYILITYPFYFSIGVAPGTYKCQGSINLYTIGNDGTFDVSTYGRAEYPYFGRRLRKKTVYMFEVTGDCCWELHEVRNFRGWEDPETYPVVLGNGQHQISIQPRSLKKVPCQNNADYDYY